MKGERKKRPPVALIQWKEMIPMFQAADKERNCKQFDSLSKKILREEARNAYKQISRRAYHETIFSDLTNEQLNNLSTVDEYPSEKIMYKTIGFDFEIRSELLADALDSLTKQKRSVILLSYFMEMTDVEIAQLMGVTPANIHYHRTSALAQLKKFIDKEDKPYDTK
ncbi:MAG: sigma-70 family RNA polymerase sigma factor [Clostridiales bacterium]|nr:sigma-70 family RNA polymerase sigma factor [Clostridiales bacterium]